jgi:YbbR domain-containing protein
MRPLRWITENFGWKVLALASAIVIWVVVASEPELSTFVTTQLTYKNLPDDLEISSGPVSLFSLELRGPSGVLRNFGDPGGLRPSVIIDMTDVQPGERTFPIGDDVVKLPRGVKLVRAMPSEARFVFERRMSRELDVVPRFEGEGGNGYAVASFTVTPKQLRIVGPASHVSRVPFVPTDRIDVSSVVGSAEFRVNAFVDDPVVRFDGSPEVTVAVTMKKK